MNAPAAVGHNDRVSIYSKLHRPAEGPITVPVNQNAHTHQVAIEALDGTAGTNAVTLKPVGMPTAVPLLEADGSTPVVLNMIGGDARADIRGSIQEFIFTSSGFDGTEYKISVTSFFD